MQEGSRVFEFIFPITEFPFIKLQAWNFARFLNKMQICVRKFSYMFFLCSIILPLVLRLSPIIFISLDKSAIRIVAAVYQVIEMLLWNAIDSLYISAHWYVGTLWVSNQVEKGLQSQPECLTVAKEIISWRQEIFRPWSPIFIRKGINPNKNGCLF